MTAGLLPLFLTDFPVSSGAEAKGLGVHVQLGPVAGALGKIPAVSITRIVGMFVR